MRSLGMIRKRLPFLITTLILLTAGAKIQAQAVISGLVTDEYQQPIELVTVRQEGTVIGTTSSLQGKYSIHVSTQDSVVLIFSRIGFQTRRRILARPVGEITLNVLLPSNDIELENLTITEKKRQTGMTEQLDITKSKLMPDASGGNIEAMIATQAGVSSQNELSSTYNVRGGSFDENMVYVNGTEVYRPLLIRAGQQEGLSFVNSSMIEKVGFSTGGFEAKYGDKMSSVLDITYKKPTENEASVQLSMLGASAYVGLKMGKVTWTQGLRYKTSKYLLGTLDTKGEYDPSYLDYQTYLNWQPNKRWEMGFIGNISQNKYNFVPTNRTTSFGTIDEIRQFTVYFDGQEDDLFRTFFGAGNLTFHANEKNDITLRLSSFHTREQETYDIQGEYWLSDVTSSESGTTSDGGNLGVGTYMEHARNKLTATVTSFSLNGSHKLKKHLIEWGTELRSERIKDRIREWEMRDSSGYSLPQTSNQVSLIYNLVSENEINSTRYSSYLQDTWKFQTSKGLYTVNAGLRGSYWDWNKEFILSPRVSLAMIPTFNEDLTFRAATGIYYQAPFYKEFRDTTTVNGTTTVTLNKNIKSQRSIHFVLAADYKFRAHGRPFRFTTEAYYKLLSNLVPYNVDNVRIRYYGENMSSGHAAGLDMKLFGQFVEGTDSWLCLSLLKAEEKIDGVTVPLPTDSRYNLSLYFTDYFPNSDRWTMSLRAVLSGGLPFGAPHSGLENGVYRAPAYKRVDMGMSRRMDVAHTKAVWLGVDVFNLLDISNVNSYYWVTDVNNAQYAVPNYLTGRRISARILIEF